MRTNQNEYNHILNMRKAENDRRDKEAKELIERNIERNIETQQHQAQNQINELCKSLMVGYQQMVFSAQDCSCAQKQLSKAHEEETNFIQLKDELYPLEPFDKSLNRKMLIRRKAYNLLPIIDGIFAFLAICPIITSKVADLNSISQNITIIIGAILSVGLGFLLSIVSRLGLASKSDGRKSFISIGGAILILPIMYMIGLAFSGGSDWSYCAGFAFVSLVIQLLLVSGYKQQLQALEYFDTKARNKAILDKREAHSNEIKIGIAEIEKKIERSEGDFKSAYQGFTENFISLVDLYETFQEKFEKAARYQLNQMVIYLGNLLCFRRMALPMVYNGQYLDGMPNVQFANTLGGADDVFLDDDFVNIDYMLHRSNTNSDLSLAETINNLKQKQYANLNEKVNNSENNNYQDQSEDEDSTSIW